LETRHFNLNLFLYKEIVSDSNFLKTWSTV